VNTRVVRQPVANRRTHLDDTEICWCGMLTGRSYKHATASLGRFRFRFRFI